MLFDNRNWWSCNHTHDNENARRYIVKPVLYESIDKLSNTIDNATVKHSALNEKPYRLDVIR